MLGLIFKLIALTALSIFTTLAVFKTGEIQRFGMYLVIISQWTFLVIILDCVKDNMMTLTEIKRRLEK